MALPRGVQESTSLWSFDDNGRSALKGVYDSKNLVQRSEAVVDHLDKEGSRPNKDCPELREFAVHMACGWCIKTICLP